MMKKRAASIFLSLCLLFSLTPATYAVSTEKFTNGNLTYCITDNTNNYVTVQAVASVPDSGAITIPDKVTNDSTEYTVVGLEGNSIGGKDRKSTRLNSSHQ